MAARTNDISPETMYNPFRGRAIRLPRRHPRISDPCASKKHDVTNTDVAQTSRVQCVENFTYLFMASPRQVRLALCGDANVGKTSLFLRFSKGDAITEREIEGAAARMKSIGSDECTRTFSARGKELRVRKCEQRLSVW